VRCFGRRSTKAAQTKAAPVDVKQPLHSDPSAAQGAPEASRLSATDPRVVRRGLPTCWIPHGSTEPSISKSTAGIQIVDIL
jgi:hypothetical protein